MHQVSILFHLHVTMKNQVNHFQGLEDVITQLLRKFHKPSLIAATFSTQVSMQISRPDVKYTIPVELVDDDIPSCVRMGQYSLRSTSSVTGGSTLSVPIPRITSC